MKIMKTVCFGGGTGLPTLLYGLKENPWLDITAVVNVSDDGGSSGELRDRFGTLPMGDILKCNLALSRQPGARELLLRRIQNPQFDGHTGGNVLLLGLEKVYGSFMQAVDALGQLLSIQGKVVPVTLEKSLLCAAYADGTINRGETNVDEGVRKGKKVAGLFMEPMVSIGEEAKKAIEEADVFCVGPGSLYTSVLVNFLPFGVSQALKNCNAKIIYIANLLTEGKGMENMLLNDIVVFAERYIGRPIDHVIAHNHCQSEENLLGPYKAENKHPIAIAKERDSRFLVTDLWTNKTIARHDSALLAHTVSYIIDRYCR